MLESALDPTRFLIVAAGRTGSTRLRLLLDSHSQAKCHGELFGENLTTLAEINTSLYRQIVEERELNPAKFLIDRVLATKGHKAVGFKILYHQLTDQWDGLLDAIVADPTIRIVHLIRRNGLKRFLSEFVVGTVTHKNVYLPEDCLPMINPIHLPPASLWQNLCSIESQTENIRRLFCNHPFHEVIYEASVTGDCRNISQKWIMPIHD